MLGRTAVLFLLVASAGLLSGRYTENPIRRNLCASLFFRASVVSLGALAPTGKGPTETPPQWSPVIEPLQTPAAPGSGQPQLSASDRGLVLSWIEREGDRATLRFSERTREGWSPARTAATGTNWFVNWADVPSVVRMSDGTLVAHWLQKSGTGAYAYDVRLSFSADEGRTWAPSFTPHHDGTPTEHGFASLFEMPAGGLGVAWLDGRATGSGGRHEAHGGGERGAMSVRFAEYDRAWKQIADTLIDARVCDCCPTTVAVTAEGPIVAYRNRSEDETRDIHVSRLVNGHWTASRAIHDDGWRIAACPVNGPALSARGRDVVAAWFSAQEEQGRAYVAFSSDTGRTFGTPVRLDEAGSLGRVDVELMGDGSALASWIELSESQASLRIRRVNRGGTRSAPVIVAPLEGSRAAGYPRLAFQGHEAVLAWIESSGAQSRVRTARFRVP